MSTDRDLWSFIAGKLRLGRDVTLMVVAASDGSSPGRPGFKMAVAADGELCGSIGGGRMEVDLVERVRAYHPASHVVSQVHRKNSPHASGMICSGEQTVILRRLQPVDLAAIDQIVEALAQHASTWLKITAQSIAVDPQIDESAHPKLTFESNGDDFIYKEKLGLQNELIIIGGGHCALALSELMWRLNFTIRIFDDRPSLNTLEKNRFAHKITVVDSYDNIGEHIRSSKEVYVAVMTLGYASDAVVIRQLVGRDFKYFGVLGSRAKMATLIRDLKNDGLDPTRLQRLRTPIGIPINSHTPEEIAVSIAAEIISIKNA